MKRVLFTSYAAQAYVGLIGLLLMPVYLEYMGIEAFGMVGLFLMLQAWLQIFDLGLSPSLSREMSLYRAGIMDVAAAWARLRSLEWILGSIALITVALFYSMRDWVAGDWLKLTNLPVGEVSDCLVAMTFAAAIRWIAGIYRAGLVGLERQALVNVAATIFATAKFVGVVPLLMYWSTAPLVFFVYQAIVGVVEVGAFAWALYTVLPGRAATLMPNWAALRGMLPVAAAMAFMSAMWIFLTQVDKLILSKTLSLEQFGYFSVAVAVAGSVLNLVPPLSQVMQPRMTILAASGRTDEMTRLYCVVTQFATATFTAIGGGLAFFSESVLWAWTGSRVVASEAAPILFWYGLANAVIGLLALPFMLQFAYGYLRLHVLGNIILAITLLPALVVSALHYGASGAGTVMFIANVVFAVFWVPLVYRRLMPHLVWRWLYQDVVPVAGATLLVILAFYWTVPVVHGRVDAFGWVAAVVSLSLLAGLIAGSGTRTLVMKAVFRMVRFD